MEEESSTMKMQRHDEKGSSCAGGALTKAYRGDTVRDGVAVSDLKLVTQHVRKTNGSIAFEPHWPETHPRCDLQFLASIDVLRVSLRNRKVLEEIHNRGIAHVLDGRRGRRPVEVLCLHIISIVALGNGTQWRLPTAWSRARIPVDSLI